MSQEGLEQNRLQKLQKAGIKVLPAAARYSRSGTMVLGQLLLLLFGSVSRTLTARWLLPLEIGCPFGIFNDVQAC